jgi:transcriptional regulator with XRE-family HTH domain
MEPKVHPAAKIKYLLRTNNTTVQQFSSMLGLAIETVRDILDEKEMPPPSLLRRISLVFGVKENYFQDEEPPYADPASRPAEKGRAGKHGCRKVDLAEIAARQQALVDILISKNVFSRDEFDTRLEILRAKVIARKMAVEKTR